MEAFYEFLKDHLENSADQIKKKLFHTPIIFLKDDKCLVRANQTVQRLSKHEIIKPYLMEAPIQYGPFFDLFKLLGSAETPTANSYARVLEEIYHETDNGILHPNELDCLCKVVQNLFRMMRRDTVIEKLYLPDADNSLVLSTELIFIDNPFYKDRIGSQEQLKFFPDFERLGMRVKDPLTEIRKIPEEHRPKMLTSIVQEKLVRKSRDYTTNENTMKLQDFLRSEDFFMAVLRLIQHQNHITALKNNAEDNDGDLKDEDEHKILNSLQQIKIVHVSFIETELSISDNSIPSSRTKVDCFTLKAGSNDGTEHVLFTSLSGSDVNEFVATISTEILSLLKDCVHHLLQKQESAIISLLTSCISHPERISKHLDRLKIRQYNSTLPERKTLFPPPGTLVPPKLHHLLDDSFCEFSDGEYVALEMFDKDIDEDILGADNEEMENYYIYAKVIRKIDTEGISPSLQQLLQKYELDIGQDGTIIVIATKIYKFHRKKLSKSKDLVPLDLFPSAESSLPEEQIRKEIKKQLRDIWNLPETERKRMIKRLIREWHPDKNPGREEMCTRICQYIQQLMRRLENGQNIDDESDDDIVSGRTRHESYAYDYYYNFGENIFRRTRRQNSRHQNSKRNTGSSRTSNDFFDHYKNEPQPNPHECRRWKVQAGSDLDDARVCLRTEISRNWICFMCHQVSRYTDNVFL